MYCIYEKTFESLQKKITSHSRENSRKDINMYLDLDLKLLFPFAINKRVFC